MVFARTSLACMLMCIPCSLKRLVMVERGAAGEDCSSTKLSGSSQLNTSTTFRPSIVVSFCYIVM